MLPNDCVAWLTSKAAIDRAGQAYRNDPTSYAELRNVQCYRLFRLLRLDAAIDKILAILPRRDVLFAARLKRLPTIVRKLDRQPGMQLSRMADVIGLRIIAPDMFAAEEVVAAVEGSDWFQRKLDYWAEPQASGYRALHAILRTTQQTPSGNTTINVEYELQVRTYYQHLWGLVSESMGEQVKEGAGPESTRSYLVELSRSIAEREDATPEERQKEFPTLAEDRGLVLLRMQESGSPLQMQFGNDYTGAVNQLFSWEEGNEGRADTLLLAGVGDVRKLGMTHATMLGMTEIPLPNWMPQQELRST